MTLRHAAAIVVLLSAGCASPISDPPLNLIVVSVDTLRADHMSLHGYARRTTPRIDAFAERAVTFDRARAPWPKTVPSMVSMFTSRPPHVTGVMFGSRNQYIADDELMLAEIGIRLRLLRSRSRGQAGDRSRWPAEGSSPTVTLETIRSAREAACC